MPVKIFFCYAHEDELLLKQLKKHLIPLLRQGLIEMWYDREIIASELYTRSSATRWYTQEQAKLHYYDTGFINVNMVSEFSLLNLRREIGMVIAFFLSGFLFSSKS